MQLVQVHSFFRAVTKAHKGVKFSCPRKNQKTTTTPTSTKCFYFHIHKGFSCMNHAKTDSRDFEEAKTAKISDHVFLTLLAIFVPVGSHLKIVYILLTAPWTASNTYTQVARAQLCAHYAQHIKRLCATCATCHVVRRDSSATKLHRAEIAFILTFYFIGWNHSATEGRKLQNPEKTPDKLQKIPYTKAPTKIRTRTLKLVAGAYKESRRASPLQQASHHGKHDIIHLKSLTNKVQQ